MIKKQDANSEQDLEGSVSGPVRPLCLRKVIRGSVAVRCRTMNRKGQRKDKAHGGIHERHNKRMSW
jgi:hypothetical protein